jgi:SOUL heme-binding protein
MMRRSALQRFAFIGAFLFISLLFAETSMAIEEPPFTVISKEGNFELRDYAPYIVAEVVIEGDRDSAASAGFRVLAGYIFGGNTSQSKIAMTAPVTQSKGEKIEMTAPVTQTGNGSSWVIRFMMPQNYTIETLPKPDDERIHLKQIAGRRVAVLQFSGLWTEGNLDTHRAELAALLAKKSLKPKGTSSYAFYDPPWKPFFWRRNEILQDIEKR